MRPRITVLACSCLLTAIPSFAQFGGHAEPGVWEQPAPSYTLFENELSNARWKLGRYFLSPTLEIRQIGVRTTARQRKTTSDGFDIYDTKTRPTASLVAGLKGYLPVGRRTIWTTEVLPRYTWLEDGGARSGFRGRIATRLIGETGRLGYSLGLSAQEHGEIFSSEFEDQVTTRKDRAELRVTGAIRGGLGLFLEATYQETGFDQEDVLADVAAHDRDESIVAAGLLYQTTHGANIGLGIQESESDFSRPGAGFDRSNTSTAGIFRFDQANERLRLALDLAVHEIEFDALPEQTTSQALGRALVGIQTRPYLGLQFFGRRSLGYSLNQEIPYYLTTAFGVSLTPAISSRLSLRVLGESGVVDYQESGFSPREDDFVSYGLIFNMKLRRVSLNLGGSRRDYDSNFPEFDRTVDALHFGLGLDLDDIEIVSN